jgi:hypothetical protein
MHIWKKENSHSKKENKAKAFTIPTTKKVHIKTLEFE